MIYPLGEEVLTNFDKEDEALYREAIKEFEKRYNIVGVLYIDENAYWENGNLDPKLSALCCTQRQNFSKFWDIFREIERKENEESKRNLSRL